MEIKLYIFKQMLYWLVVSTMSLIGIVWLSQALKLIELLVNKGAPLTDFLILTMLAIPLWLTIIAPIGGLIAAVLVMSKLQQDREITVMHAVGLSSLTIAQAPLVFGSLISIFLLINSALILPQTFSGYKTIINNIRTSAPIVIVQEGVFTDITPGLTIFIEGRNGLNDFSNIFVHDTREENKVVEVIAKEGRINFSTTPPQMEFSDGVRSEYTYGETQSAVLEFESYSISLKREYRGLANRVSDYNELPISVLLAGESSSEHYSREMRAEGHYRLASPFLGLSLVVIGIATILRPGYSRSGSWRQIAIATTIATAILILMVTARGATVTTPPLFPLMYVISITPALTGLYFLHNRARPVKVQA
jgi:lipopolysaccharide export system permease protein